jgi:hypothetical protein
LYCYQSVNVISLTRHQSDRSSHQEASDFLVSDFKVKKNCYFCEQNDPKI